MNAPNAHPRVFVPGKIIQVRSQEQSLVVSRLVFISVEEHARHVSEMLAWLYPDATELQKAGATLHDVGKKVGARTDFTKGLGLTPEELRADFYGSDATKAYLAPQEAGTRYVAFAEDGRHRRLWPTADGSEVRMDLDPPFGNHAADATEDDIRRYRTGTLNLGQDLGSLDYVLNLVRLHHSFQPDRIIGACARHGEGFVTDLYRLIVADHTGSRWAEYVAQKLEGGLEQPEREDYFGDVKVSVAVEPRLQNERSGLKLGSVRLCREMISDERGEPPQKELLVHYHVVQVNWDLSGLAEESRQRAASSPKRAAGTRRRKSRGR